MDSFGGNAEMLGTGVIVEEFCDGEGDFGMSLRRGVVKEERKRRGSKRKVRVRRRAR
ncbi:MAG: hypothetical protein ACJAQT_000243 [Akkermansiaceae bacterium]